MENQFSRTQLLLGKPALDTFAGSRVAVFGVGGVGGYVVEVLARSGVGELDLFDNDTVSITNVNRQIIALLSNVGRNKVDVAAERVADINRQCIVNRHQMFYLPSNADEIDLSVFDYVVDCIDTITAKIELIKRCHECNTPIICSMGAANKLDATGFRIADIKDTKMDPLAKVIRKKLRELNIHHLKVVYSEEVPLKPFYDKSPKDAAIPANGVPARGVPASNAFVPAAAGLIIGGEVIKDLMKNAHTYRISPEEAEDNEYALAAAKKAELYNEKVNKIKNK